MVFASDPVMAAVEDVLARLERGETDDLESTRVDLKEEAGRRGPGGTLLPGTAQNDRAATHLVAEAACMANSDGGGALIVGVGDDGTLIGTELDSEWLRGRIYDLSDRRLTVDARSVSVQGVRLLVLRSPQAIEPIRVNGRVTWRVDDRCVEVDPSTWHARRMTRERYDWSEQNSHVDPRSVRPEALSIARRHLRDSGETHAVELATVEDAELLRRLNVVTSDGYLTNAGALTFVGRGEAVLDYLRREAHGGDRTRRVRDDGLAVLEELDAVERAISAHNGERPLRRGLVIGHVPDLPAGAVRESLVNGIVHRDWASADPTTVEHTGRALVVTSPGGFIGGVTESNIITHPSQARNRALAQLFAKLRIAEREGIGVDRMVRDMLAQGYPVPEIQEGAGPSVRAALVGDPLDERWIRWTSGLRSGSGPLSLTDLILLRRLVDQWWLDVQVSAPLLQLSTAESAAAIHRLTQVTDGAESVLEPVSGTPAGSAAAWSLSRSARTHLDELDPMEPHRDAIALDWAQRRGRISSTELSSILGTAPANVNRVLKRLAEQGLIAAATSSGTGRGFHYLPVQPE